MITNPRVWIVILNWNRRQQTLDCIASVRKTNYPNFSILVVDNGSTDDSAQAIRMAYPDIELLETGANLGYAGGNNAGLRHALANGAQYCLVLNNDTLISSDLIQALVDAALKTPDGAFFSPRIYHLEAPEEISYLGGRWDPDQLVVNFIINPAEANGINNDTVTETDVCHGCAIFFSRETVEKIGLMNEKFFLIFEETDWCFRARETGKRCYVVHAGRVWHHGSLSFGGEKSALRQYFHTRNFLLFGERHLSPLKFLRLFTHVLGETFTISSRDPALGYLGNLKRRYWDLRRALHLCLHQESDPLFYGRWRGLRDYLFRRFGDCPAAIRNIR